MPDAALTGETVDLLQTAGRNRTPFRMWSDARFYRARRSVTYGAGMFSAEMDMARPETGSTATTNAPA